MLLDSSMKKTVVIGATSNVSRYSFIAAEMLAEYNHVFVPIGIKNGKVLGRDILDIQHKPPVDDVDTITLYIGPATQAEHYDYLLSLKPRRIIFNPGTENPEFEIMAGKKGVETLNACTLVLLRLGSY